MKISLISLCHARETLLIFSKIVSALKILGPVKLDTQKLHEALSIKSFKYSKNSDIRHNRRIKDY